MWEFYTVSTNIGVFQAEEIREAIGGFVVQIELLNEPLVLLRGSIFGYRAGTSLDSTLLDQGFILLAFDDEVPASLRHRNLFLFRSVVCAEGRKQLMAELAKKYNSMDAIEIQAGALQGELSQGMNKFMDDDSLPTEWQAYDLLVNKWVNPIVWSMLKERLVVEGACCSTGGFQLVSMLMVIMQRFRQWGAAYFPCEDDEVSTKEKEAAWAWFLGKLHEQQWLQDAYIAGNPLTDDFTVFELKHLIIGFGIGYCTDGTVNYFSDYRTLPRSKWLNRTISPRAFYCRGSDEWNL